MSRLKRKDVPDYYTLIDKVEVYMSRIGKYRYTVLFLNGHKIHGKHTVLLYTGETVNGRLYGEFNGVHINKIRGTKLSLHDAPSDLIEDAKRFL